ncbi:hypothetical protein B0H17DRAFT_837558, partial [Mycena rosella]
QGELSHRLVKRFYARTNKRNYGKQIAAHERRRRVLRGIKQRMQDAASTSAAQMANESDEQPRVVDNLRPEDEDLPRTPPRQHHHISESKRSPLDVREFSSMMAGDRAVENFIPDLRSHLLSRLLGLPYDGDEAQFSSQDLIDVTFVRDRLYTHKVMRINYTTYDM